MSTTKEQQALQHIENQLKAGYIDLIDREDIDEITIIRKAIELYKEKSNESI